MAYDSSKVIDVSAEELWTIMRTTVFLFTVLLLGGCLSAQKSTSSESNKELVSKAFEGWKQGKGTVFDLLAADATWIVAGSSPVSATYHGKQELLEKAVKPISSRLSKPIVPEVESIVSEGNHIVVLWHGQATALDGKPYNNTYLWHLTFENGSIIKGTALLDTYVLTNLIERIPMNN
jgi:ketosteroid isomerase-like protein